MDSILQQITDWIKEMLVSGVMDNLNNIFDAVNGQVGEIATEVGTTPQNFSPAIFNMIRNLSENVIMPIAGIILTFIACYELIQLIISYNNLANFETLATYGKDAKSLLKELQSQNERMFLLTFIVMNTGRTKQELENNVFQAASIAQKHNCNLVRLDYQQEQGLTSSLPLASNQIEIHRGMTTSSTAIFVPFTTQELFQSGDESLYYGLNALSNNLIMVDRKLLKNPNGLILGTPGSGKSFAAKREIANAFLVTDDDVIISDPEAEYSPLVERFGGQVIKISPTSTQYPCGGC